MRLRDKTTRALELDLYAIQSELDLRGNPLGQMVIEIEALPGVLSATWDWEVTHRGRCLNVRVLVDQTQDIFEYDLRGIVAPRAAFLGEEYTVTVTCEPERVRPLYPGRFLDW